MSKTTSEKYPYSQNRELSWLAFNKRVLEEASNPNLYPLERLKFVSIFSSNLDEFFMIRVGSLFDLSHIYPKDRDNKSGLTASEQLNAIFHTVSSLMTFKKNTYLSVMSALKEYDIQDLTYDELASEEESYIKSYYKNNILPLISPIIIGPHHPVPHLVNKQLYIAALLKSKKDGYSLGIIPVPEALPPFVRFEQNNHFIRLENIILKKAGSLFGSAYTVQESCIISATRNGDISLDNEKFEDSDIDFRNIFSKALKKRDHLAVMRLELSHSVSDIFLTKLMTITHTTKEQVMIDICPLNMHYVYRLASNFSSIPELHYPKYTPRYPEDLVKSKSIIDQVLQKDKLLFYPFDSVEPFIHLLNEAADRKDVLSIQITIYRLASSSKIAHILCRAAENGKKVLVLMELRARFDEENNLSYSKQLEDSGCQVIYGIEGYKCHSKICSITLRKNGHMQTITQIGTGNYNEKTNSMYTDLSYITASKDIAEDASTFFRNMLINNLHGNYHHLCVSPLGIKELLIQKLDQEIKKGKDGYVCIKANSITEKDVIDKLSEASCAGVEIQLIIRGICCIVPGIVGYTENIHVTSIVGRFLEHARIYRFGRENSEYYISSSDLMSRNLNRRVEIACPVLDQDICHKLQEILEIELKDNTQASVLQPDGTYYRKQDNQEEKINSQEYFMEHSLHNAVKETHSDKNLLKHFISLLNNWAETK